MYGKLNNNGALELFRGDLLVFGDKVIANPREDDLKGVGYMEVDEGEEPVVDNYKWVEKTYAVFNGKIVPLYEEHDKEVHEQEYPTNVADGFHVERRENIEERDVFITYDVVPDNVDMEVEIGDINATTDNSEYDVELEVENQDDGEQADSGNTGNK